jgi:hypothetical protein
MDRAEAATLRPFASALLLSYSPKCLEGEFCELRFEGVLGSWRGALEGSIMSLAG